MGFQTRVHLLDDDILPLLEWLETQEDRVFFVPLRFESAEMPILRPMQLPAEGQMSMLGFCTFVRESDFEKIRVRKVSPLYAEDYYTIQSMDNCYGEFSQPGPRDNKLRPGRIYFLSQLYFAEDRTTMAVDEDFRKWAKRVLSKARRLYTRDQNLQSYVGPAARRWAEEEGGELLLNG